MMMMIITIIIIIILYGTDLTPVLTHDQECYHDHQTFTALSL
jgi:hypothetical protein